MQAMNDSAETPILGEALCSVGDVAGAAAMPLGARDRPGLLIVKLGALLADAADARLDGAGLDSRGYMVLAILSDDGPGTQAELAQMLGKAPGVVVTAVDELEAAGLVARTRDPADRRRSRVTLTEAGRAALARGDEIAREMTAAALPGLDASELATLQELLVKGVSVREADAPAGGAVATISG